ncbi:hypothetical protein Tco_1500538 [Tanacetum coccineum]
MLIYNQNIDFSQLACSFNYSLLVDPDLIGPWLQTIWATATLKMSLLMMIKMEIDAFPKASHLGRCSEILATSRIKDIFSNGTPFSYDYTLDSIYVRSSHSMAARKHRVLVLNSRAASQSSEAQAFQLKVLPIPQMIAHSQRTAIIQRTGLPSHEQLTQDAEIKGGKVIEEDLHIHSLMILADQDAAYTPDLGKKKNITPRILKFVVGTDLQAHPPIHSYDSEEQHNAAEILASIKTPSKTLSRMDSEKERETLKKEKQKRLCKEKEAQYLKNIHQRSLKRNNHLRAFDTLREILHVLDRQEYISPIYELLITIMNTFLQPLEIEMAHDHMLAERRYPLSRELMIRMLEHGMEVEDESETCPFIL